MQAYSGDPTQVAAEEGCFKIPFMFVFLPSNSKPLMTLA